jgi:uncharacterized protein YkwD
MRSSRRRSRLLAFVVLLAAAILFLLAIRFLAPHAARTVPPERTAPSPVASSPVDRATCGGRAPAALNAAFEHEVVELVNAERQAAGLPPLKLSEPLTGAARWFARDMAVKGYFPPDHDTYDHAAGQLVRVCDWSTRISAFYGGWTALAENIAAGAESPREVVAGWMSSPGHRAKILGPGHSETGVGYWNGGPQGSYWVQDFGQRHGQAVGP